MKRVLFVVLAFVPFLSPCSLAEGGLEKLATTGRHASLVLKLKVAPNLVSQNQLTSMGAFISDDGLALVNLDILCTKQEPMVFSADGERIKFGKVLGIFPNQNLVLMKFDHHPEASLRLAPKEPDVGDALVLLNLVGDDPKELEVPPVTGPVMAKRSSETHGLRVPRFTRIISLGARPSRAQAALIGNGCLAIDHNGDLVASLNGVNTQLIVLNSITVLGDQINALAKAGEVIPFPLSDALNPIDPATLDGDWSVMMTAVNQRDEASARSVFIQLRNRYPDSFELIGMATMPPFADPGKARDAVPEVREDAPAAQQVLLPTLRANLAFEAGDKESAIRHLESAIKLSPDDYPLHRIELGKQYLQMGKPADAERLLREAYTVAPEDVELVESLAQALLQQNKLKEYYEISEKLSELWKIYRAR